MTIESCRHVLASGYATRPPGVLIVKRDLIIFVYLKQLWQSQSLVLFIRQVLHTAYLQEISGRHLHYPKSNAANHFLLEHCGACVAKIKDRGQARASRGSLPLPVQVQGGEVDSSSSRIPTSHPCWGGTGGAATVSNQARQASQAGQDLEVIT